MPLVKTVSVDQLVESYQAPNDFDGYVRQVICAPSASTARFEGKWPEGRNWLPYDLAAYLFIVPDPGQLDDSGEQLEEFISPITLTKFGGLEYFITATPNCDPNSNVSDISWPGNPEYGQRTLDLEEFEKVGEEMYNSVDRDYVKYRDLLIKNFGGVPFAVGKNLDFPSGTNYEFVLNQLGRLQGYAKPDDANNVVSLLTNLHAHYARVEVPSHGKKSGGAMEGEQKKSRPFEQLVPTVFHSYLGANDPRAKGNSTAPTVTSDNTAAATSTTASSGGGDVAERLLGLIGAKFEADSKVSKFGIRQLSGDASFNEAEKRETFELRNDDEFLAMVAEELGAKWEGSSLVPA